MAGSSSKDTGALLDKVKGADTGDKPMTFAQALDASRTKIAQALPPGMTIERFLQLVAIQVRNTDGLRECTVPSILGATMLAAQTGLELGPFGHCYLVPYKNTERGVKEAQFQIGYKGYIHLGYQSGNITSIKAYSVYPNDEFDVDWGAERPIHHRPQIRTADRGGDPWCYWMRARFANGDELVHVMDVDDVERHRLRGAGQYEGREGRRKAWKTDYDTMAHKTLVRSAAAYLPIGDKVARIIAQDETVHTELVPNMADQHGEFIDAESSESDPPDPEGGEAAPASASGGVEAGENEEGQG